MLLLRQFNYMNILKTFNISPFTKANFSHNHKIIAKGYDFEYQTSKDEFKMCHDLDDDLFFLEEVPSKKEMSTIYPSTYYSNNDQNSSLVSFFRESIEIKKFKFLFNLISKDRKIKILDLGAGDGRLLSLLKKFFDCECFGVELSHDAVSKYQKKDINIINGNVEDIKISEWSSKFDIIIMHQLIEHTRFPDELLNKCHEWLVDDGFIHIETPQFKGLDFRLFKNRIWGGYHFPRHFFIFSENSLIKLANICNFKIIKSESILSPVFWIHSIHNYLVDRFGVSTVSKYFRYDNVLLLAIFTCIELIQVYLFNTSSNLRMIIQKKNK